MATRVIASGSFTVGMRIALLRTDKNLSQRELADRCPTVSHSHISRIEIGDRNPSWRALSEIADALGTTGLFLLTGDAGAPCPFCHC